MNMKDERFEFAMSKTLKFMDCIETELESNVEKVVTLIVFNHFVTEDYLYVSRCKLYHSTLSTLLEITESEVEELFDYCFYDDDDDDDN